jgi:hypothetical protein
MRLEFCVACGSIKGLNHHHLVPQSRGGSDEEWNLITLCRECHGLLHGVEWSNDASTLVREGQKRAMERGVKFGRDFKLTPHQRQEAIRRREAGETLVEIARSYNVSHPTIMRLVDRHQADSR